LIGRRAISLEEVDRRRGFRGESLYRRRATEAIARRHSELTLDEDISNERIDASWLAAAGSSEQLVWKRAHRLDREPENGPAALQGVIDGATSSGAGCNYIKDVPRAGVEPLA